MLTEGWSEPIYRLLRARHSDPDWWEFNIWAAVDRWKTVFSRLLVKHGSDWSSKRKSRTTLMESVHNSRAVRVTSAKHANII